MKKTLFTILILVFASLSIFGTNALDIDGNDDYVNCGDMSSVEGVQQLTVETWVYFRSITAFEQVFYKGGEWFDGNNISIEITNGGTMYVFNRNGGNLFGFTSFGEFVTGQWYHVAYVFDGTAVGDANRLKLYKNGVEVALTHIGPIPATTPSNNFDFVLGANSAGGQVLDGMLDEFRVWNTARTGVEIMTNMNTEIPHTEPDLIAYYRLNEGIPNGNNAGVTTANDLTGNGNDGTLNNFALNGTTSNWVGGTSITALGPPPAPIPTLSEWGLIILALFLMTLGTLYLLQPSFQSEVKVKG